MPGAIQVPAQPALSTVCPCLSMPVTGEITATIPAMSEAFLHSLVR